MRLLVAEDDALLGEGIQAAFKIAGYAVDWVQDGQQALLALEHESYCACVLDLSLPKLDGLTLLKTIRQRKNAIPVLILTARDSRQVICFTSAAPAAVPCGSGISSAGGPAPGACAVVSKRSRRSPG